MKNLVIPKIDILVVLSGVFIRVGLIVSEYFSIIISIDLHVFLKQRIETNDPVSAISDDLCIAITPEQELNHHHFPE